MLRHHSCPEVNERRLRASQERVIASLIRSGQLVAGEVVSVDCSNPNVYKVVKNLQPVQAADSIEIRFVSGGPEE